MTDNAMWRSIRRRYIRIRRRFRKRILRRLPRFHRRRWCSILWCDNHVWFTTPATRNRRGKVFCSRACKGLKVSQTREYRQRVVAIQKPKCPRPDKLVFDTEAECREAFAELLVEDETLGVYQCRCGRWHAGHDTGRYRVGGIVTRHPIEGHLDPITASQLRALFGIPSTEDDKADN